MFLISRGKEEQKDRTVGGHVDTTLITSVFFSAVIKKSYLRRLIVLCLIPALSEVCNAFCNALEYLRAFGRSQSEIVFDSQIN